MLGIVQQCQVQCRSPIIKNDAIRVGSTLSPGGAAAVEVTSIDARCWLTWQGVSVEMSSRNFVYIGDGDSFNSSGDPLEAVSRH